MQRVKRPGLAAVVCMDIGHLKGLYWEDVFFREGQRRGLFSGGSKRFLKGNLKIKIISARLAKFGMPLENNVDWISFQYFAK
jgi:hypothetical protein